jgi:hypothetical protein
MTCAFVAQDMYGLIVDSINYEANMIIRHIHQTYKYSISYFKASARTRLPTTTYLKCYLRLLKEMKEVIMMCLAACVRQVHYVFP